MSTLISSLKLAVTSAVFGLTVFNIKPVAAQTFFQSTITAGADNYSDTTGSGDTNGFSNFIQVGSTYDPSDPNDPPILPPSLPLIIEEASFINWNLTDIINDINGIRTDLGDPGIILGNVDAFVTLTHTKTDPDNPNDNNPPQFGQNGGFLLDLPRIYNINAYQVVNSQSWSEGQAIDTNSRPQRNNLILFNGNIQANSDEAQDNLENNYGGIGLNQVIAEILNNNLDSDPVNDDPNLSITLEATEILEFTPIGFHGLESFFSQNGMDESVKPQLTVRYELLQEGNKVQGGPNFKAQTRGGGTVASDWELAVFSGQNQEQKQEEWVWTNNEEVDFELACDPNNGNVTLTLSKSEGNNQRTSTTPNFTNIPCEKIDGLKIFATARTNGAKMEYMINEYTTISNNVINISDLSVLAEEQGSKFVDDLFPFPGFVDTQLGTRNVKGTVRMSWGPGGDPHGKNDQGDDNPSSDNQTFLIPLTKIFNLNPPPEGSLPEFNKPTSEEIREQRREELGLSPSVPEPNSIVALVLFVTTGGGLKLLGRKR